MSFPRRQEGQSTVELALVAPVLVGLFALALQGGLIISDQVNLEHYATEAAAWSASHPDTATTDTIRQHIYQQMCAGSSAPPNAAGARYCSAASGNATVTVTERSTPVSTNELPFVQAADAAACTAKSWNLSVTPSTPTTADLAGSGSAHFAVTLSVSGSGSDPDVSLSLASPRPTALGPNPGSFLTPYFSPADVTVVAATSALDIQASGATRNGTYNFTIVGTSQACGKTTTSRLKITVNVINASPPTPPSCADPTPTVAGVDLTVVSNAAASVITISGANFTNGATVRVNNTAATLVTVVSSTQIVATLPAGLPTGVYNLTVTNPDNCAATAQGAVTVVTSSNNGQYGPVCTGPGCPGASAVTGGSNWPAVNGSDGGGTDTTGPGNTAVVASNACAPDSLNYQMLITITWSEPLIIPWISSGASLTAAQYVFCQ